MSNLYNNPAPSAFPPPAPEDDPQEAAPLLPPQAHNADGWPLQPNLPPYTTGPPPPYSFDDAFLIPASGTGAPPVIEIADPPRHWAEKNFFLIVYCLASLINALGLISLPWLPGTSAYIVQSKFPNTVTGTLNGLSVINLSNIRVSLARNYNFELG